MVHTFTSLGRTFLLDVESGSIFEIDETAEAIIKDMISPLAENAAGDFSRYRNSGASFAKPGARQISSDFSRFTESDVSEAKKEIDELIREGVFFSSALTHPPTEYKGIVKALCLNIAHACNLRCKYCFAGDGQYGGGGLMSAATARNAVDFLLAKSASRKQLEIDFFGGEPLLNMDVVKETVLYANEKAKYHGKDIRFTITTNALTLTDELIDYFNENMYNVVLSIDGRKTIHDGMRKDAAGKGSYDRVLANALKFAEWRGNKSYYVRGTFTDENRDFAADALALNDLGFGDISLEPVVLDEANPLALSSGHLPGLINEYEKLACEYLKRRQAGRKFNFFHFNMDIYNGPCATKRLVGCNAGSEYLAVSPGGNIYPCHRFDGNPDYIIGNTDTGAFDTRIPQSFARTNLTVKEKCGCCWAKYYCGGGCAANSILFSGDILKPYTVGCELMKKRVECALAISCIEREGAHA